MEKLGIIVGGGPAPGINGVIAAAGLEALNRGVTPIGLYDGFTHLLGDGFDADRHTTTLSAETLGRIHFEGGSVLRTARTHLLDQNMLANSPVVQPDKDKVARARERLRVLDVGGLLTIGGDDTALSARFLAEATDESLRVVHVPKTIDNDLPLPGDIPTFGFATARHVGAEIVSNLMKDAQTSPRWYVVVTMGRNAGFLALGIGKAVGATVTLIPEEFGESTTIEQIVDILEAAILKQRVHAAGHPRLSHVPLAQLVVDVLSRRLAERGDATPIIGHTLGWELRSARPQTSDLSYSRDLGHGGVRLLCEPPKGLSRGAMVTIQGGNLVPVPFDEMIDPATNRTRIRRVDLESYTYSVARAYMIRLERTDFESPARLAAMAGEARITPEQFRHRFGYLVGIDDPGATQ
jgi:6-phosphofructokinase